MKTELAKFEAAKHALAEAKNVDEVKAVRNKAMAVKLYAKQANDRTLEADALEIRMRAERRLGEMQKAQPKAKGGAEKGVGRRGNAGSEKTHITLAEAGIDKNLAHRARQAAAMPEADFEKGVQKKRAQFAAGKAAQTRKKDKAEKKAAERDREEARHPFLEPWCTKFGELFRAAAADLAKHGFGTQDDLFALSEAMRRSIMDEQTGSLLGDEYDDESEPVTDSAVMSDDERRAEMEKLSIS
jgi:hypothetical protein